MRDDQVELETKVAFLEKSIAELSDVLYSQHQQIERLEEQSQRMSDQLKALAEDAGIDPGFSKPPHY